MYIFVTVLTAFRNVARNRLRTSLVLLGIIIGIGTVIASASIGQGARSVVQAQMATYGTNVIIIEAGTTKRGGARSAQGSAITLTASDAEELKGRIPLLKDTCWWRQDPNQVVHRNKNWYARVQGISPSCLTIRGWTFTSGEPFTQADMEATALVALLGTTIVENLFETGEEPVGVTIRIKNVPFRVIGVLAPKGQSAAGNDQDDIIFIPFTTAQRKVNRAQFMGAVELIYTATDSEEDLQEAEEAIRLVLRERHRFQPEQPDDFTVRTQLEIRKKFERASEILTVMLFAIASISLLVGGVGIMNILLVSVSERIREIGVRLAVGAKQRHIFIQFLIEAMTLNLLGGMLGIVFGFALARAITVLFGWPTIISTELVLMSLGLSLTIGLFSGLYPAYKAAHLNPIEALRYE